MTTPTLHLYTDSSPNGFKITIALEELALPYTLHHIHIDQGQHRDADFLKLNPHGRIPVLHDAETGITLFESAAILLYLADKTGRLLPSAATEKWEAITWLMFHSASMGPILGQRVHAECFAVERDEVAVQRYRRLSEDLFAVLDARLAQRTWLAGNDFSIADIATFGWMHIAKIIEFDFSRHMHLSAWHQRANQRPAVQRGIALPQPAVGP